MDTNALAKAVAHTREICPKLQSLLIVHRGRLIVERYFDGVNEQDPWNIKSASKSMLSALVGIALEQGAIQSLDQPVIDFFPEYKAHLDDPRKKQITIRHLLTMTAGLEWTENGPITFRWLNSKDRIGFVWKSRLIAQPGTRWNYSTALTHLLSAVLTRATGTNTLAFARQVLLNPLGAQVDRWDQDKQGYYIGGSELFLRPRDMAKFGYLYLNNGQWENRQIVPRHWVQTSTGQANSAHYGFLWWLDTFAGHPIYFAQGLGGQHIVVVPHLDVVVVTTSYLPTHISALTFLKLWILPSMSQHEAAGTNLPPAQQVLERFYGAIGGTNRLAQLTSLRTAGVLEIPAMKERGTFELLKGGQGRILERFEGVKALSGSFGSDGQTVWTSWHGYRLLDKQQAQCWRDEARDWSDLRGPLAGIKTVALTTFEGRSCYQLDSQQDSGAVLTDFYAAETGLLAGSVRLEANPYGWIAVTRVFSDYRSFGELRFPTRIVQHVQGPEVAFTRSAFEFDTVDMREFQPPIAIEDLQKERRGR